MRLLSLLLTLLVVAWLIYSQWGSGAPAEPPPQQAAQARAAAVQVQVDEQFVRQAGQLERMEVGAAPAAEGQPAAE